MKPTRTYILIACLFASLGAAAGAAGTNALAARAAAAAARLDAASAAFERAGDTRIQAIASQYEQDLLDIRKRAYIESLCKELGGIACKVTP